MDRLLWYAGDIVGETLVVSRISYQGPTIVTYVGDVVDEAYICEGPAIMDRLLWYAGDVVGEALVVSRISYQGPSI